MKFTFRMFPKRRERGAAIVLALFMLVVLAFLLRSLVSTQQAQLEQIAVDYYGAKALLLAQSGIQRATAELMPFTSVTANSCAAVSTNPSFNATGFIGCSLQVSCTASAGQADTLGTVTVYHIESTAQCCVSDCSANDWKAVRKLAVEAKYVAP